MTRRLDTPLRLRFPKGVRKTSRPKMTNVRGRTWDVCDVILPDGEKIRGHLDYTWGTNFYFEVDGSWYRGPIYDFETVNLRTMLVLDLRDAKQKETVEQKEAVG